MTFTLINKCTRCKQPLPPGQVTDHLPNDCIALLANLLQESVETLVRVEERVAALEGK